MGLTDNDDHESASSSTPVVAMTIAGSDSGGNAGLAADVKSFAAHGAHGVFAITVVTAQNTTGITSVEPVSTTMIEAQIDAVAADFRIGATKTGLLFSAPVVERVAARAAALGPLVVDPVLVSSTGTPLFDEAVMRAYVDRLFPVATVITPNAAEASLLTGIDVATRDAAQQAAMTLLEHGSSAVLVTGLLVDDRSVDVLATEDGPIVLEQQLVRTKNVLGTGCSLSASIAARLAHGDDIFDAVEIGRSYVLDGLRASATWQLGAGRGPIDHLSRWPGLR
jgi:hydroxymethylpyrimidine/phosphomethylpyrimidine kinase